MKGCIFSLGKINKKIIWPFLFALIQVALYFINQLFPKDKVHQLIDGLAISLGKMLVFIIPFLFKGKEKILKKDEICTRPNIKYQAILWSINLTLCISIGLASLGGSQIIISIHNTLLVTREAVEIIILIIITMIIFKSKYYIHHIICLVIFCGLCVGIDFLLDNYKEEFAEKIPLKIIFSIVVLICEIVLFCYQKYMMNTLYYHYWTISFSLGLFLFLFNMIILISVFIFGDKNNENSYFYSFFQFLEKTRFKYIFPRIITWIVIYGLIQLFQLLALESLTPNHMMISYELGKIAKILNSSKSIKKWHSLILFSLQLIILLFFLEIFEFNFCNLNKNTKRSIEERSLTLMDMGESSNNSNEIEIGGYSFQENSGNNNEMHIINNDTEDDNGIN